MARMTEEVADFMINSKDQFRSKTQLDFISFHTRSLGVRHHSRFDTLLQGKVGPFSARCGTFVR